MRKYSYHREAFSLLTQFAAAFDDCFVYRYTKDGLPKERIDVRYVFGPKDRVIYDIVNQNKQFTLPAVSMNQTNIRRDVSRNQNKEQYIYRPALDNRNIARIPQPIPVNMDIEVSIIAKYKEDIDQIVSNFIPYCNPYFIISWKVPESYGIDFIDELRSEVTWSGEVSYENPMNLSSQDKYRITGSTTFTIKGWIFPADELPQAPIYTVRTDFKVANLQDRIYTYDDHDTLSKIEYDTDVISISANPEITNVFYNKYPIFDNTRIYIGPNNVFTLFGKRFDYTDSWYLSANSPLEDLPLHEISTVKSPTISAYKIPEELIERVSDNIVNINVTSFPLSSINQFTILGANEAFWNSVGMYFVVDQDERNMYIQPNVIDVYLQPNGVDVYTIP